MKTLYLDGCLGLKVRLDGPALRARRPGCVDGRYPLARISRIVAVGPVEWMPDALAACLQEHKPIAVLDRQGRFVRGLFNRPQTQFGLTRRMAGLLDVPRFRDRYADWFRAAEETEMAAAASRLGMAGQRDRDAVRFHHAVRRELRRRWDVPLGRSYRYLRGMAAAHIAAELALAGILGAAGTWSSDEYRMFCDLVRLESWRQIVLLSSLLGKTESEPDRRALTLTFEAEADSSRRRVATHRKEALFAIMTGANRPVPETPAATIFEILRAETVDGGCSGRVPFGAPGSLRTSMRIMREYLESDRRSDGLSRAA